MRSLKAVPKVNTDGLYLDVELVDDSFLGVVPFYDPPERTEEIEPEAAGYIVGVPVPQGLFRPRFDIVAWNKDNSLEPTAYWTEDLTAKEIEQLMEPEDVITSERVLAAESVRRELEVLELKQQNTTLGAQVVAQELLIRDLSTQYEALGKSMVALELKLLDVTNRGGGDE